jgi:ABC-2 type transport system ATP-binding protein
VSAALEAAGLTKYYGKQPGIIDLNLEVAEGEVFGFLGPNGAGKTTTIRLLLDLLRPTRGSARILGLDSRRDGVELRRRLGYVPGELALYGRLTGEENLRYFAALRGGVDWGWVRGLAERFGADLTRRVGSLSTGNKRKVALLQAFMHRPAMLILDEPTSGLDPLMQHEFYALLRESREAGQTVLLSSHLLPEVQEVCGRAAFVREGRLVAVEDMSALGERAVHQVEVEFAAAASGGGDPAAERAAAFAALPGVSDVAAAGRRLRFTVSGGFDLVVKQLARSEVVSLKSAEPDLEDVFMTYYGAEALAAGAPPGDAAVPPASPSEGGTDAE